MPSPLPLPFSSAAALSRCSLTAKELVQAWSEQQKKMQEKQKQGAARQKYHNKLKSAVFARPMLATAAEAQHKKFNEKISGQSSVKCVSVCIFLSKILILLGKEREYTNFKKKKKIRKKVFFFS